jgi:hypothetical protein
MIIAVNLTYTQCAISTDPKDLISLILPNNKAEGNNASEPDRPKSF